MEINTAKPVLNGTCG